MASRSRKTNSIHRTHLPWAQDAAEKAGLEFEQGNKSAGTCDGHPCKHIWEHAHTPQSRTWQRYPRGIVQGWHDESSGVAARRVATTTYAKQRRCLRGIPFRAQPNRVQRSCQRSVWQPGSGSGSGSAPCIVHVAYAREIPARRELFLSSGGDAHHSSTARQQGRRRRRSAWSTAAHRMAAESAKHCGGACQAASPCPLDPFSQHPCIADFLSPCFVRRSCERWVYTWERGQGVVFLCWVVL